MTTVQPIEVELDRVYLTKGGAFRVELRFDDDSYLTLDLEPESDAHYQLVEVLTRVLTRMLSRLGERGVAIVGLTESAVEEPEEEQ